MDWVHLFEHSSWIKAAVQCNTCLAPTFIVAIVLLILSGKSAIRFPRTMMVLGGFLILSGLMALGLGALGYWVEMDEMERIIEHVVEGQEDKVRAQSEAFAHGALFSNLIASVLPTALGTALLVRGLKLRAQNTPSTDPKAEG